jgi:hypothetical protein
MKIFLGALLAITCSGCAIASRSDKFGADIDIGIGGIFSYIADIHIKANVGFSKDCKEAGNVQEKSVDPLDRIRGSLQ